MLKLQKHALNLQFVQPNKRTQIPRPNFRSGTSEDLPVQRQKLLRKEEGRMGERDSLPIVSASETKDIQAEVQGM